MSAAIVDIVSAFQKMSTEPDQLHAPTYVANGELHTTGTFEGQELPAGRMMIDVTDHPEARLGDVYDVDRRIFIRPSPRPLPLGANRIRPLVTELVHELEVVSGKEFRSEALGILVPGERLASDNQFQTLFALTPNAGFSIVPSLRPVTSAMASLDAFILQPTEIGSQVEKDGSRVSGLRVFPGYESVYDEYQNLLGMAWVLNANKYKNGAQIDPNTRFHIVLLGMRPVSQRTLDRLLAVLDEAEAKLTKP